MANIKKGMDELYKHKNLLRARYKNHLDNDYLFDMYNKTTGEDKLKFRNMIVENNLQLVIKFLIRRYNYTKEVNPVYDMEDVIQEGNIILIETIEKYNPSKGKFSTFLYEKLTKSIYYVNSIPNSPMRISKSGVYRYRKVKILMDLEYDDEFISKETGLPISKIKNLRAVLSNSVSYEELLDDNKIENILEAKDNFAVDYLISRKLEQQMIDARNEEILKVFKKLSMRDRHLLIRMFGFDGNERDTALSNLKEDFGLEGNAIYCLWKKLKLQISKDELLKELFYNIDSDYDDHNFDKTYYLQK